MASRYSISLALGVIQADAEDVGVGELVHALVERAEDRLEVERGGDLAADLAEQLDVALAFALGPRERLGGLGAQPGLGELRALALLGRRSRRRCNAIDGEDRPARAAPGSRRTPTRCGTTAAGS